MGLLKLVLADEKNARKSTLPKKLPVIPAQINLLEGPQDEPHWEDGLVAWLVFHLPVARVCLNSTTL